MQDKLSAFRSVIHRLNSISLNQRDCQDKGSKIKYLAEAKEYNRTIIKNLPRKIQNKQQIKAENNKFIKFTYINNHIKKISRKFKKAGYSIAYRTTTNKTEHKPVSYTHLDVYKRQQYKHFKVVIFHHLLSL